MDGSRSRWFTAGGLGVPPIYVQATSGFLILPVVSRLILNTESHRGHPALDVAVSHAALDAVARGDVEAVLRLHVPGAIVAFGRADRAHPGYPEAVRAAVANGFGAVERLAGGRAAVFHEHTIAFALAAPEHDPTSGIQSRFASMAEVMVEAFETLGVDARIGEVPGEYCPGRWSVNVGGKVKVMGVGQRLVRGAAHVGGVVVVDGGERIRDVLIPIYRALEIDWDPRTTGALADRAPGLDNTKVIQAIVNAMARRYEVIPGDLPPSVIEAAEGLVPEHLPRVA